MLEHRLDEGPDRGGRPHLGEIEIDGENSGVATTAGVLVATIEWPIH